MPIFPWTFLIYMSILIRTIHFFAGLLLVLVLSEGYLRWAGISERSDVVYIEGQGKMLRPSQKMIRQSEGFAITHSNTDRYLGPNHSVDKPAQGVRIALLGDSFVEGYQVWDRDHFRSVLTHELTKRLSDSLSIEVLNCGRSNFDLGNMYAYSQLFVDDFSPDYQLFFVSWDDLSLEYDDPLLPSTYVENGELVIHSNTNPAYLRSYQYMSPLLQHSHLFFFLNKVRHRLKTGNLRNSLSGITEAESDRDAEGKEALLASELSSDTYAILEHLHANTYVLVWRDHRPIPPFLLEWLDKRALPMIDLSPLLESLEQEGKHPFYWSGSNTYGHWNPDTHLAIGKYLAIQIDELLIE